MICDSSRLSTHPSSRMKRESNINKINHAINSCSAYPQLQQALKELKDELFGNSIANSFYTYSKRRQRRDLIIVQECQALVHSMQRSQESGDHITNNNAQKFFQTCQDACKDFNYDSMRACMYFIAKIALQASIIILATTAILCVAMLPANYISIEIAKLCIDIMILAASGAFFVVSNKMLDATSNSVVDTLQGFFSSKPGNALKNASYAATNNSQTELISHFDNPVFDVDEQDEVNQPLFSTQ